MYRFRFALLLLLPATPALAQASSPRADPCSAPEHH